MIRLLTFNTLLRDDVRPRLRALGPILDSSPYDVVCLQELMWRRNLALLRELAPSYRHVVAFGAVTLHGGLAILSRHPVSRPTFARYPLTGPARAEILMRKGALMARVQLPSGELAIVNTHLSANRDDNWSRANRYTRIARAELGHLADLVNTVEATTPVVVTGDFNVPRSSSALADFLSATGAHDAMAGDVEPTYRPTPRWPDPPAFDHVLVRAGAAVPLAAEGRIVLQDAIALPGGRSFLSDHFGVEATISATGREATSAR